MIQKVNDNDVAWCPEIDSRYNVDAATCLQVAEDNSYDTFNFKHTQNSCFFKDCPNNNVMIIDYGSTGWQFTIYTTAYRCRC